MSKIETVLPKVDVKTAQGGAGLLVDRLRDRFLSFRDRLLTRRDVRQRAAGFFLTRPLVRRRARALFDLTAGFVYFQILHACVQLDVFETLADGPLSIAELSGKLGLDVAGTRRLMDAAVALDLAERRSGNRYGLGELGLAMVNEPGLAAMVRHHALVYRDLQDPVGLLAGGGDRTGLQSYWAYATSEAPEALKREDVEDYSELMAASQSFIAEEVLDSYSLDRHRTLLDVGGGAGAFAIAAARRAPHLQVGVFDLPAVADIARKRFSEGGLTKRARAVGGSFMTDDLPRDTDLITLVRVLYDHPDATVETLLRSVYDALQPGGTLLIAEPMSGIRGAGPVGDAYFGFYLLAMGSGRPRRVDEHLAFLKSAGFQSPKLVQTRVPLQTSLIVAHR
ncbi:MAG: methyltransferase [Pseudomonadota bacterium]